MKLRGIPELEADFLYFISNSIPSIYIDFLCQCVSRSKILNRLIKHDKVIHLNEKSFLCSILVKDKSHPPYSDSVLFSFHVVRIQPTYWTLFLLCHTMEHLAWPSAMIRGTMSYNCSTRGWFPLSKINTSSRNMFSLHCIGQSRVGLRRNFRPNIYIKIFSNRLML